MFVHTGMMTMASPAVSYVCVTCGFFEDYIAARGTCRILDLSQTNNNDFVLISMRLLEEL